MNIRSNECQQMSYSKYSITVKSVDGRDEGEVARLCLEEFLNVGRHFIDLSSIECLNFTKHVSIMICDKTDCNTLSTENGSSTDSVNVAFFLCRKIIVDDE